MYEPLGGGPGMATPGTADIQLGQLAGARYDICLVFPYKTSSRVKYGEHSDPVLNDPSSRERRQMERWDKKRSSVLKQLVNCGLEVKPFYSRDKDEVFCKIGTDIAKLQEVAEMTKHKLQMKEEYLGAHAPYIKDFPGRPDVNYADRKVVSHVYKPRDDEDFPTADSIFRTADRIQLLDHVIRSKDKGCAGVDIGALVKTGDLKAYFPLHENKKLDELDSTWWSCFVTAANANKVRDYFGERIGFYFSWNAHFSKWLFMATLIAAIFIIADVGAGTPDNTLAPIFCIIMALWSILFTHYWRRKAHSYALEWGVFDLEPELEAPRPEFFGTYRINPITEKQDLYYPWTSRVLSVLLSYAVITVTLVAMLIVMATVFVFRHLYHHEVPFGRITFMLLLAVVVDALNSIFSWVVKILNDRENYRTQTDYENALLAKTVVFKFVNSYAALYYIAFFKDHSTTFGLTMHCARGDCMIDLSWQLAAFFLYRLIASNFIELLWPKVVYLLKSWMERRAFKGSRGAVLQDMSQSEQQCKKESYNPFDDFDEMVVQFGYCSLFVVATPWILPLAVLANVVECWVDKNKLIHHMRRPMPLKAKDNGSWDMCFEVMGFLAVFTNAALVVFTTEVFLGASLLIKLLWFLAIEHLVILARIVMHVIHPEVPEYVRILNLKHKHIVHKHVDCVDEEDETMRAHALQDRELKVAILDVDDDDDD
ncbi:unnamed protein product [Vitrella brassicaformis CCMP3155]|uniref:Uncharacterized protein n=1 Tax=Vitrella brassicaformis (strain CCMP3155) TaxID=1169540 RepID=A0A0G4EC30_VITBC|nr:unnamed protein product [Vitrella brassicaformis CCMP3155]|eukprot:CEL93032.1 unnamed protein product [Vitrella brassicaformis CCMP3155]